MTVASAAVNLGRRSVEFDDLLEVIESLVVLL